MRNAFRLRQARRLKGQDLVLVDDILTTGATSREICKVLKRDGQAGRILILTVARVVQWSGDFLVAEERRVLRADLGPASFRAPGVATWSGGIPAADQGG